ncbi:TIGR01906 family membrane protein [Acetobacterium sp.]|uniref:TIGR01906 family membrane protein n=1 Tax=Acetobacterium sp. TaxID=1872094 RepID=UPI002723F631|nr:TIGR01906 family membrane protein [Acetobacterium sp.]MDO9492279.1 TIGR01906 family membrane protein [Acetobacterium sp.]
MNKTIKIVAVLLGVLVPVITFISGIEAVVFDKAFYMDQMRKNQVTENTGIYPPDMDLVVNEIISYLKGDRQDFDIKARLAPENAKNVVDHVSIFNDKEITHMDDVRDLLLFFLGLRDATLILALIAFLILLKYNNKAIIKALFYGSAIFMVILLIVGASFIFNFNDTFILFHQLFFANDLWIMNPSTDRLIWIVPEPFFFAMIGRMVIYILMPLGLTTLGSGLVLFNEKKRIKKCNSNRGKHENS